MKRLTISLLSIIICFSLAAETVVRGRVFEGKGKNTVEFANVGIYRPDNKLVGACASDSNGNFEIKIHKDGDYQVLVYFSDAEAGSRRFIAQVENWIWGRYTSRKIMRNWMPPGSRPRL